MKLFLTVLFFVMKSIFWTPRHEFGLFPLLWVPSFGGADFVNSEVQIYFLQCTSCDEINRLDPEARVCMLPLLWVPSFSGADRVDPEVRIYFLQWITL